MEMLTGESQYLCDLCGEKRDATRQIVITRVPKVLWVQLLRYEYNKVTWDKEKLKVAIAVDESLDVEGVLAADRPSWGGGEKSSSDGCAPVKKTKGRGKKAATEVGAPNSDPCQAGDAADGPYDLVALIEHRGAGAHGGHYVGRMREWTLDRGGGSESDIELADAPAARGWWLFDDTEVSKVELPAVLATLPELPSSSNSAEVVVVDDIECEVSGGNEPAKPSARKNGFMKKGSKFPKSTAVTVVDSLQAVGSKGRPKKAATLQASKGTSAKGTLSKEDALAKERAKAARPSSDSYVILYVSRARIEALRKVSMEPPPPAVVTAVAEHNATVHASARQHREAVGAQLTLAFERKATHSRLFGTGGRPPCVPSAVSVKDGDEEAFVLVDAQWLRQWVSGVASVSSADEQAHSSSKGGKHVEGAAAVVTIDDDDLVTAEGSSSASSPSSVPLFNGIGIKGGDGTIAPVYCELPPDSKTFVCAHERGVSPATARELKKIRRDDFLAMLHWEADPQERDRVADGLLNGFHLDCPDCVAEHRQRCKDGEREAALRMRVVNGLVERETLFVVDAVEGDMLVSKVWATAFKAHCENLLNEGLKRCHRGGGGSGSSGDMAQAKITDSFAGTMALAPIGDKKKIIEDPNSALRCEHGGYFGSGKGSTAKLISGDGWEALNELLGSSCPAALPAQERCTECTQGKANTKEAGRADKAERAKHLSGELSLVHRRSGCYEARDFDEVRGKIRMRRSNIE